LYHNNPAVLAMMMEIHTMSSTVKIQRPGRARTQVQFSIKEESL